MLFRGLLLGVIAGALVVPAPAAAATTVLRSDGLGPLRLGMSERAARATGWISDPQPGCELRSPVPRTYDLDGRRAPAALRGGVEFTRGRLGSITTTAGARTPLGVTVRRTTVSRMVAVYRGRGYRARREYVPSFRGTFVTVSRRGRFVLAGFGSGTTHRVTALAIPFLTTCE